MEAGCSGEIPVAETMQGTQKLYEKSFIIYDRQSNAQT